MIKYIILLFLYFSISNYCVPQSINYDEIILPEDVNEIDFKEKLVQLAWNNLPTVNISKNEVLIAEKNYALAKYNFLNSVSFTANINEFVIDPSQDINNRAQFFPLYNFSLSIPLGIFVSSPLETKISKLQVDNQKELVNAQKLEVRSTVLTSYENYIYTKEMLEIEVELLESSYAGYLVAEQKFKNGEILIDEYNNILTSYNNRKINHLTAVKNFNIAKIQLEEIIGVRIEDIKR